MPSAPVRSWSVLQAAQDQANSVACPSPSGQVPNPYMHHLWCPTFSQLCGHHGQSGCQRSWNQLLSKHQHPPRKPEKTPAVLPKPINSRSLVFALVLHQTCYTHSTLPLPPGPTEETALTVLLGFSSSRDAFSLHYSYFSVSGNSSQGGGHARCSRSEGSRQQSRVGCGGRPWWEVREGMTLTAPPSTTLSLCQVDDAPSH